jgi:hypothetical protein
MFRRYRRCGRLDDIVAGRKPVKAMVAERLGKVFGDGAAVWLRMQVAYDGWGVNALIVNPCVTDRSLPKTLPMPSFSRGFWRQTLTRRKWTCGINCLR